MNGVKQRENAASKWVKKQFSNIYFAVENDLVILLLVLLAASHLDLPWTDCEREIWMRKRWARVYIKHIGDIIEFQRYLRCENYNIDSLKVCERFLPILSISFRYVPVHRFRMSRCDLGRRGARRNLLTFTL